MPPLGLVTVAAVFPEGRELRLVDLNLRARLIELGIALTGDVARAEAASERALALI